MNRFIACVIAWAAAWTSLPAQPFLVRGTIESAGRGTLYLAACSGDRFTVIDSLESGTAPFLFVLPAAAPPGVYRILYPETYGETRIENRFVEFIYNREDVNLTVARGEEGPVTSFENSLENQVYNRFMRFELEYEEQLSKIYPLLDPPRPGDAAYDSAVAGYDRLQEERNRYIDSVSALHPGLYAVRIMNAFRTPPVSGSWPHEQRIDSLRKNYFRLSAIDDPLLLHAPVYNFRIIEFLSLFRSGTLTASEQQKAYVRAVDQVMVNTGPDPALRSFAAEFMLEGFELLGYETVLVHLADHYLDETCTSDVAELVRQRKEGYRNMAAGSQAPDFVVRGRSGVNYRLSHLDHPYLLVMFWSSACPHCTEMIPELHAWYTEENALDLEVVAISIDSTEKAFTHYTDSLGLEWISAHEPLGWTGRVPSDYHIYATPSLFLLDGQRRIIDRPMNMRQFRRAVRKLEP